MKLATPIFSPHGGLEPKKLKNKKVIYQYNFGYESACVPARIKQRM